ncbi:MAG: hypothetical protein ACRDU8_04780, partial [Egibacteraceae bacterium]
VYGMPVTVWARTSAASWRQVAVRDTSARGRVAIRARPRRTTIYTLRSASTRTWRSDASRDRTVWVRR